ncbi:MAG TPA: AarF/UbiB family protein [Pyrinomonadaceae bacterium]|jgi:predicted unusual protein kinase regulating ubiquinone biosynthesis (AarF/ABC1/UbiB family)|nr:AarF/UbiB family protein [Pyrinomonadaceae bacterium]
MGISLKPEHLKRYKDITMLFMKYGRSDLVKQAGLEDALGDESSLAASDAATPQAEELADDLEKMGPTFVKLGQLLSTRADLLPAPYLESLARLQDKIEPFSFKEVERIVTSELGVRISKAFAEFESTPMAAASLGQVHRARLRDGREVVVKIQRPGVREQIAQDLDALEDISNFLDTHTEMGKRYEFGNMLLDLRKSLLRELDYRQEAGNLISFRENLKEFQLLIFPAPIEDFTTSYVLTMEFIQGKKITELSPLRLMETDGRALADQLFSAYLKQMLVDGVFHADPHPGNVFLTDDNRIALIDLGMVGRIMTGFQENMLRLLLSISEGRGDETAEISMRMGEPKINFDETTFRRRISDLVAQHRSASLDRIDAGQVVLEITRISADCWFRLPPEFTMIAKTLLNLDQVVYTLEPSFDPNAVIRRRATDIMQQRLLKTLAPGNVFSSLIDLKDFVEKLPARVNKILDAIGKNEFKIKVDAIEEKVLLDGLQKIANRITMGLVLAALIIGASMLMRVETSFKILGYPGLPMIFFLLAAGGALALLASIVANDRQVKRDGHK